MFKINLFDKPFNARGRRPSICAEPMFLARCVYYFLFENSINSIWLKLFILNSISIVEENEKQIADGAGTQLHQEQEVFRAVSPLFVPERRVAKTVTRKIGKKSFFVGRQMSEYS